MPKHHKPYIEPSGSDDTAAIAKLISKGGAVTLRPGRYIVSALIPVPPDTAIYGLGAAVVRSRDHSNPYCGFYIKGAGDVRFNYLTFDNGGASSWYAVQAEDTAAVAFTRCVSLNGGGMVKGYHSDNIIAAHCRFFGQTTDPVFAYGGSDHVTHDCYFERCTSGTVCYEAWANQPMHHLSMYNNIIEDSYCGPAVRAFEADISDVLYRANLIRNVDKHAMNCCIENQVGTNPPRTMRNVSIVENTVEGCGFIYSPGSGVYNLDFRGDMSAIENVEIVGNVVKSKRMDGSASPQAATGLFQSGGVNVNIVDNTVEGPFWNAGMAFVDIHGGTISGNRVSGCEGARLGSYYRQNCDVTWEDNG